MKKFFAWLKSLFVAVEQDVYERVLWSWSEGGVDRSRLHFLLTFKDMNKDEEDEPELPVAYVGVSKGNDFHAEFLLEPSDRSDYNTIMGVVIRELNLYIVELSRDGSEYDPEHYLQAHCGMASNIYSVIHWNCIDPDYKEKVSAEW
jgi:hypothetical protein